LGFVTRTLPRGKGKEFHLGLNSFKEFVYKVRIINKSISDPPHEILIKDHERKGANIKNSPKSHLSTFEISKSI
jgi:hypothetical protein